MMTLLLVLGRLSHAMHGYQSGAAFVNVEGAYMSSIRNRVILLFAALGTLAVVVATVGIWGMIAANFRAGEAYAQVTLPTEYLEGTDRLQSLSTIMAMNAIASDDPVVQKGNADAAAAFQERSDRQFELFRQATKSVEVTKLAEKFVQDRELAMTAMKEAVRLARAGEGKAAQDVLNAKARSPGLAEADDIERLIPLLRDEAARSYQAGTSNLKNLRLLIVATILTGGVVVGFLVWRQMTSLGFGLGDLEKTLGEVSGTLDLSRRFAQHENNEIGRTSTAFNVLMERIEASVRAVAGSSGMVRVAAGEIAGGNADLSARTEEQAASIEQTAASMTQLTETVKQNADNARQANTLATRATELADNGNDAVQGMVGTIDKINGSSTKISEITGVIEGIAFQTNILALNAAVEAARAGEQGRGFAVVASEVRSLAQRSAAAAKEIKELIASSVAMIQGGAQQATEVSATMDQVKRAIKQVSDIVGEIAAASEEQRRGIEQVNQAVGQMDDVTQQNAALVEQASAAAQSLEEQAIKLTDVVSAFKVTGTDLHVSRVVPQKDTIRVRAKLRSMHT
jgi:methyl-accepting chemotaxis protein